MLMIGATAQMAPRTGRREAVSHRSLRVALLSSFDARHIGSWSGCSSHLVEALAKVPDVSLEFIGPLAHFSSPTFAWKRLFYRLAGKTYLTAVHPDVLKSYASEAAAKLAQSHADFVLGLDAAPIAYLETTKPILYFWDSTFLGNLDYPFFNTLAAESIRHGHQMEQLALTRFLYAVFASGWAVQTALDGYSVDRNKLKVVPLGANLECDRAAEDVRRIIDARDPKKCRLLFLGVDWIRKGGEIAYAVAKELNARGLDTTLTIAGCRPTIRGAAPAYLKCLGFINKLDRDNRKLIESLLSDSHFLIVPSSAESFGTVFCEASSFGTPSLARRVGGVGSAVRDGVNGKLFSKSASISEYCDYIIGLFRDYSQYKALALSAFEEYRSRLNWERTSEALVALMRQME